MTAWFCLCYDLSLDLDRLATRWTLCYMSCWWLSLDEWTWRLWEPLCAACVVYGVTRYDEYMNVISQQVRTTLEETKKQHETIRSVYDCTFPEIVKWQGPRRNKTGKVSMVTKSRRQRLPLIQEPEPQELLMMMIATDTLLLSRKEAVLRWVLRVSQPFASGEYCQVVIQCAI